MSFVTPKMLFKWCEIPFKELVNHPKFKIPFCLVKDSEEMGLLMAEELVHLISRNNEKGKETRAIIPCSPSCWYRPFTDLVNKQGFNLKDFIMFHMDDCLDWQGRTLPVNLPYNFKAVMERGILQSC